MVTVSKIEVRDFLAVAEAELDLPERGVVLVTAPNGLGKSARTLEATSWALFGKSARHPAPEALVREGAQRAVARVTLRHERQALVVERARSTTKSPTLSVSPAPDTDTTAKASSYLNKVIGIDHETWLKTHTVSAKDVMVFTTSTPSERKLYVEAAAGLRAFVAAHDQAVKARKAHELVVTERSTQVQALHARWQAIHAAVESTRAALAASGEVEGPTVEEATAAVEAVTARVQRVTSALQVIQRGLETARAHHALVAKDLARVSGGVCGLCKQVIPPGADLDEVVAEHLMSEWALQEATAAHAAAEDLRAEQREAARALQEAQRARDAALAAVGQRMARERDLRRLAEDEAVLEQRRADHQRALEEHAAATAEHAVLRHVERSLSPAGFRGHAMARAVGAVSSLANVYLGWLAEGIRVEVTPTSTRKTGAEVDEIGVRVLGAGGGGYGGCSDGQRMRVDLAIVLALSALSPSRGTLFFDECFDHLDRDGVERTVRLIDHLSSERCVVLITHNVQLIDQLPRARHVPIG